MNLLLLPGNHKMNREWIEGVRNSLSVNFNISEILYYSHWKNGGEINFEIELQKIQEIVKNWKGEEYVVFAKSAGTVLTLLAFERKIINPKAIIFVGSAVYWAKRKGIDFYEKLSRAKLPILFIQQNNDPAISYSELYARTSVIYPQGYVFICVDGDDHAYKSIEELGCIATKFISNIV